MANVCRECAAEGFFRRVWWNAEEERWLHQYSGESLCDLPPRVATPTDDTVAR